MPKTPEERRAYQKAYREKYPERIAAYVTRRKAEDPDYFRSHRRASYHRTKVTKEKKPPRTDAENQRHFRYGITPEQYNAMVERQGGACAICQQPKKLHVDHCHTTKIVRGLLCHSCNTSLGHFEENPDTLRRAIEYISQHRI